MPTRYIKESTRHSQSLAAISSEAERLFWRLVVSADDYGCYEASADIILGTCFPRMLRAVKEEKVADWLLELTTGDDPLAEIYENNGQPYVHLLKWDKHQKGRAKAPKYPLPSDVDSTRRQMSADADKCEQMRTFVGADKCLQTQTNVGLIGIGIGIESESVNPPSPPGGAGVTDTSPARRTRKPRVTDEPYSEDFERFWSAYPRRIGKKAAWRTWHARIAEGKSAGDLIAAAERYTRDMATEGREMKHMLLPTTFLGPSARYEDYLPSAEAPPTPPAPPPLPPPEPEVSEEQRQRNIAGVQELQRKYLRHQAPSPIPEEAST